MQEHGITVAAVSEEGSTASQDAHGLAWIRTDWLFLALLALAAALTIGPFWQPGVSSDADMLMGAYRVFELDEAWQNGILFPRLGADLNFTYGAPLFQYYPPLVSFGALIWHKAGLGLIEASKAMFALALLLAAVGVYVYARWFFESRPAALVSGFVYLFSPYVLTNIYERGAAAETLALAIVPWVFWAVHRLVAEEDDRWLWLSAALIALLVLAHNITALFVVPTILAGALAIAWHHGRLTRVKWVGLAIALGLGLSAFYWLPALAEIGFVQVERSMVDETKNVIAHLVPLRELVQTSLVFDYWGPMRFRPAFWQIALGMLAIVGLAFQDRKLRFPLALLAVLWMLTLALQLSISRAFWESLALIRFIQFPWRLLGLTSFCLALLTGSLWLLRPTRGVSGWVLAAVLLGFIVIQGTARLSPRYSPIWYPITSEELSKEDLSERGSRGFALFSDYLPDTVQAGVTDLPRPRPPGDGLERTETPAPLLQILEETPNRIKLLVATGRPFVLRLHRFYFPGWQAYVGSRTLPVAPSGELGLVSVSLVPGVYPVEFRFEDTPLRRAATIASALSLLVLLVAVVRRQNRRAAIVIMISSMGLVMAILLARHQGVQQSLHRPILYPINFQDEIRLLGHDLEHTALTAGDELAIRLYWLAQKTALRDYTVFLHLVPADDSALLAQVDDRPLLGYGATSRWEPGELVVDEHSLPISTDTPPGSYYLLLGLYQSDPWQNLKVLQSPAMLPGERAILATVEIVDKGLQTAP